MSEPEELPIEPVPGPVDVALEEPVEAPRPVETGYFIERPTDNGREFLMFSGGIGWTADAAKAMRFTRPEDAQAAIGLFNVPAIAHVAKWEFPV